MARPKMLSIGSIDVAPGETCDLRLKVSETYTGDAIEMPVRVQRATKRGPIVFVTAAIHGDEINGAGIIRELSFDAPLALTKGTLICVPVVNIFGFESHSRYMPDRRDLNRSFPGNRGGSLASRFAAVLFEEIVSRCDYGIDLHSAAVHRTNYANVRADVGDPGVKRLATAFGCELIVHGRGPEGSFRREACKAGCPVITVEAGEVMKIEPSVLEVGVRGIRNVLIDLGMLEGPLLEPSYQITVRRTTWVRAEVGGLLRFHVAPGDLVQGGEPIATNASVFGDARSVLIAPESGVVLGMTTHPAVKPGEPVCNIALTGRRSTAIRRAMQRGSDGSLPQRHRQDLATNISVAAHEPEVEAAGRRRSRSRA